MCMLFRCNIESTIIKHFVLGLNVQRPSKMGNDFSVLCFPDHVGHAPAAHADASEAHGTLPVQRQVLLRGEHDEEWYPAPG